MPLWKDSGIMSHIVTYIRVPAAKARGSPRVPSTSMSLNRAKKATPAIGVIRENAPSILKLLLFPRSDSSIVDESENSSTNLCMHKPMVAIRPTSSPAMNMAASARPSQAACMARPMNDDMEVRRCPCRSPWHSHPQVALCFSFSAMFMIRMVRNPRATAIMA